MRYQDGEDLVLHYGNDGDDAYRLFSFEDGRWVLRHTVSGYNGQGEPETSRCDLDGSPMDKDAQRAFFACLPEWLGYPEDAEAMTLQAFLGRPAEPPPND
ncbi:hypothetical protein [uncultured Oscillibacter sp.]|uniref:hypothetical protein n=1 Tax=uncultured Oscillibacter sp. TaxID=876091 RepID=UPI0025EAAC63|nr:hypothetical protein [uncultured Oscillibacter sp.]